MRICIPPPKYGLTTAAQPYSFPIAAPTRPTLRPSCQLTRVEIQGFLGEIGKEPVRAPISGAARAASPHFGAAHLCHRDPVLPAAGAPSVPGWRHRTRRKGACPRHRPAGGANGLLLVALELLAQIVVHHEAYARLVVESICLALILTMSTPRVYFRGTFVFDGLWMICLPLAP